MHYDKVWHHFSMRHPLPHIFVVIKTIPDYGAPGSHCFSIGPILDDRLKEKILKPWKGAHSIHSVCV